MEASEVFATAKAFPRYSLLGASVGVKPTPGTGRKQENFDIHDPAVRQDKISESYLDFCCLTAHLIAHILTFFQQSDFKNDLNIQV